jgi:hypothetical protein
MAGAAPPAQITHNAIIDNYLSPGGRQTSITTYHNSSALSFK